MLAPNSDLVQQDVSCHEYGVCHKPCSYILSLLACFLLELDHPVEPTNRCYTLQQPVELRMSCHMTLDKYGRLHRKQMSGLCCSDASQLTYFPGPARIAASQVRCLARNRRHVPRLASAGSLAWHSCKSVLAVFERLVASKFLWKVQKAGILQANI